MDHLSIDIKTVKQWVMHAQVAEHYVSNHQRIILAGDAAHRFPPAGGFGMNTGIQDAHNLAWKLAAVLKGVASHALLGSYESERKPIAKANTALSVENFKAAMSIPAALGLDPSNARFVHRQINEGVGSLFPRRVQQTLLETIFALGRTQVAPYILNAYNPFGSFRLRKLKRMLDEGQSLQLQFPAEDLGFRYSSGALVRSTQTQEDMGEHHRSSRRNDYKPACRPGTRLPHLNITVIRRDTEKSGKVVISTLDLIKGDGLEFYAFVGPNTSGYLWGESMLLAAKTFKVKLKVVVIWPLGLSESKETSCSTEAPKEHAQQLHKWDNGNREDILHVEEVDKDWWQLCKLSHLGAILVRPDDHVAWVSSMETSSCSIHELHDVFATVLSKQLK